MFSKLKNFASTIMSSLDTVKVYSFSLVNHSTLPLGEQSINISKTTYLDLIKLIKEEILSKSDIDFKRWKMNVFIKIRREHQPAKHKKLINGDTLNKKFDKDKNLIYNASDDDSVIICDKDSYLDQYRDIRYGKFFEIKLSKIPQEGGNEHHIHILKNRWNNWCEYGFVRNLPFPFSVNDINKAIENKDETAFTFLIDRKCPVTDDQKNRWIKEMFS